MKELWRTPGSPELGEFISIGGMVEGPAGDVWIADTRAGVIYSSSDGVTWRIAARHGDGPGEVRHPTRLAERPGGGIAVLDEGHGAIALFDARGGFERRFAFDIEVYFQKGFAVLQDHTYLVAGGSPRSRYSVQHVDSEGALIGGWHPLPKTRSPRASLYVAGGPMAVEGPDFVFSQAAPHSIYRYSMNRKAGRVIASDPDLLEPVGDDFIVETGSGASLRRTFRWAYPRSTAVFVLADGRILNILMFHEVEDQQYSIWQLYSAAGQLVANRRVESAYHPFAMTANGDVLASLRDFETQEHLAVRLALELPRSDR